MNSTTKHTEALSVTQRARGLAHHFLNHLFSTSKSAASLNLFVNNWLNLFFTTEDTEALSATQKKQWGLVSHFSCSSPSLLCGEKITHERKQRASAQHELTA